MKQLLPLIVFFIFKTTCPAQTLTLTAADCNPTVGDVVDRYSDNPVSPGNSGIGQLWDFSMLNKNFSNSYTVMPTSMVAQPGEFVNCNISMERVTGEREFYNASASSLVYFGTKAGNGPPFLIEEYTNPETMLVYPLSYNVSNIDTWNEANNVTAGSNNILCDGTGTLITPFGTYNNTLRVRSVWTYTSASVQIKEDYSWYAPGVHGPLLSIYTVTTTNNNGTTQGSQCRFYDMSKATTDIRSLNNTDIAFSVFPNPASGEVFIDPHTNNSDSYIVKIIDMAGILVHEEKFADTCSNKLNISNLSKGAYILELQSNGNKTARKKLLVD